MRPRPKTGPVTKMYREMDASSKVSTTQGVLAQLYRSLLHELQINERDWFKYLSDYLRRFARENPGRSRTAERGNSVKAFTRPVMSWRTFLRALVFTKIRNVKIVLEGESQHGKRFRVESPMIDLTDHLDPIRPDEITDEDEPDYLKIPR